MISEDVRARIRRLFFAEHWKVGTIAAELGLHRDTVACAVDTSRFHSGPTTRESLRERSPSMESSRYGDLEDIAAHTDGDCHLCHQPTDLDWYGRTGAWGEDTVTVDHLWPQSWGGSDHIDNLRLAHGTCNSRRGTRDVELVRKELAGTTRAPLSSGEKAAWSIGGGGAAALVAGYGFAEQGPDGQPQFNARAAVLTGLLVGCLLRATL